MAPNQSFDAHAHDYEEQLMRGLDATGESKRYFAERRVWFLREWWSANRPGEPARVIDYGCGLGDVTALLAGAFPESQVRGIDSSSRCVELASEHYAGDRIRFSVLETSSASEPADLIHLNGVVHHVEPRDRPQLFADFAARLVPGGIVSLFENNPINPGTRIVMSRIPFDRDAIPVFPWQARRELRRASLRPILTRYLFYFPRSLRAFRPLERLLVRVPLGGQYLVLGMHEPGRRSA
jgi:2-polyprenyl-3-methyl-5-hydroxy-6-metoxy-1,4-benzoquinol methylase